MKSKAETKAILLAPTDEVQEILREAIQSVEDQLSLEDAGWINLSGQTGDVITDQSRVLNLKLSRLYAIKDPLGKQSIRIWTDYTHGTGLTWQSENDPAVKVLKPFWNAPANQSVLSARGQRKSSDKVLIDGEIFFAIFLGTESTIRTIDPLEIVEIITNPEDREDVKYYKRQWSDPQGGAHTDYYRDWTNMKEDATLDASNRLILPTQEAVIYHFTYNTTTQRGNPLLLPALDWIKQYRRFLASRVAVMLALARFAWKTKVKGGQAAVDAMKAKTHEQEINAGSQILENLGVDTKPIKTESGASAAKEDARMLKLQVCSAVGIPEQYFGDISTGNLATAKTVELPLIKMFQSYQKVWNDAYRDINNIILEHNDVPEDKRYVDIDFPVIVPLDVEMAAQAIKTIVDTFPEFAESRDVQQQALMAIGVDNPQEVIDSLEEAFKSGGNPTVKAIKVLRAFRESIKVAGNGHEKED